MEMGRKVGDIVRASAEKKKKTGGISFGDQLLDYIEGRSPFRPGLQILTRVKYPVKGIGHLQPLLLIEPLEFFNFFQFGEIWGAFLYQPLRSCGI